MKKRATLKELEDAADAVSGPSLEAAKSAVAHECREYLRWAEMYRKRLDEVSDLKLHKFARAFSLCMLGHLPSRPETCPFCIQFGKDKSCLGCGYAQTHGRCDAQDSSFSLFIEAFQELGRAIYQDTEGQDVDSEKARKLLVRSIDVSENAASQMLKAMPEASAFCFMGLKASFLDCMICSIPLDLLSAEVKDKYNEVLERLKDYW
jgi:hypothetical protein